MAQNIIKKIDFPQSDWNQTDSNEYSYIKNKPDFNSKLNKNLGGYNSGKVLIINNNGEIVPATLSTSSNIIADNATTTSTVWSSSKIANALVNNFKDLGSIIEKINYLPNSPTAIGKYISSDGSVGIVQGWCVYENIEIEPNTKYYCSYTNYAFSEGSKGGAHIAFFSDSNSSSYCGGAFTSDEPASNWNVPSDKILTKGFCSFTTPDNAKYLSYSCPIDDTNKQFIIKASDFPLEYNPSEVKLLNRNIRLSISNFLPVFELGKNLFNKYNIIEGYNFWYADGKSLLYGLPQNDGSAIPFTNQCFCPDYIPCKPNTTYIVSHICSVDEYDINCNFKAARNLKMDINSPDSFTTSADTYYLRVGGVYLDAKDSFMLRESGTTNEYEPFKLIPRGSNYGNNFKVLTVSASGNKEYTTISEAVAAASTDDIIFIYPGVYEESVHTNDKRVHLIGLSKERCVLTYSGKNRSTPPLEIAQGSVRNITIKATNTGESNEEYPAYCVHIDNDNEADGELLFENVDFINEVHQGVGIGLRSHFSLIFDKCNFKTENKAALYCHDWENTSGQTDLSGQQLIVKNCTLTNNSTTESTILLQSQEVALNGASCATATFIENNVYNESNGELFSMYLWRGGNTFCKFYGSADWELSTESRGNNVADLNYDYSEIEKIIYNNYPTTHDSGSIITLANCVDNIPLKSLQIDIKNDVRPIVITQCGNNLADIKQFTGITNTTVTHNDDNSCRIQTVVDTTTDYWTWRAANIKPVIDKNNNITSNGMTYPPGEYYIKFKIKANPIVNNYSRIILRSVANDGQYGRFIKIEESAEDRTYEGHFKTIEDTYLSYVGNNNIAAESTDTDITIYDLIVSKIDVPYEPYVAKKYTINIPSKISDINNGVLDVINGNFIDSNSIAHSIGKKEIKGNSKLNNFYAYCGEIKAIAYTDYINQYFNNKKLFDSYNINTKTSNFIEITDGKDELPPKELKVNIEPISSQTVTSATIIHCGKNLIEWPGLDNGLVGGIKVTPIKNGKLSISGTATSKADSFYGTARQDTYDVMPLGPFPPGTYTITAKGFIGYDRTDRITASAKTTDGTQILNARISGAGSVPDDGTGKKVTFTANDVFKMFLWINIAPGSIINSQVEVQMERGKTLGDWEPYNGRTYTFDWSNTAGAISSGTLDVLKGELNVDNQNYKLFPAEPLMFEGENNFFADYGETSISYYVDPKSIINQIKENQEAVIKVTDATGAMIAVAETYFNEAYSSDNLIQYNSGYGPYTTPIENNIKYTGCSQFVKSVITGTLYENSKYVKETNSPSWWGYEYDGTTTANYLSNNYLTTNEIAKYCEEKGLLIPYSAEHSNIKPGDLLFSKYGQETYQHVAIAVQPTAGGYWCMEADKNTTNPITKYIDNVEVALRMKELKNGSTLMCDSYARLPITPSAYTVKKIKEDNKEYSGSYSSNSTFISSLLFEDPLPLGFYTVQLEDDSDSPNIYVKINKDTNNENISGFRQGKYVYIVFYSQMPLDEVDIYCSGGTNYKTKDIKLFKGYLPFNGIN